MKSSDASILLLPGLESDGSFSMIRYARELQTALGNIPTNWDITMEYPQQRERSLGILNGPQARRVRNAWFRYVTYPRQIRRREADVFHVLDHGYSQLLRRLDPDRTIITCHDLIPLLAAKGVIQMHVSATVALTFRLRVAELSRARRVITNSEATKSTLEQYTPVRSERIVVVPYGVNSTFTLDAQRPRRLRASIGLTHTSMIVLQVASGGRYKNTPVVLRAFAQLRSRVKDVVLVRVGAPFYPEDEALAGTLGIRDAVRLVGPIDDDHTMAAWYNEADVLMFPSSWEGFGWPPLEAMACGTPVVASHIPAVAEVVGDAAVLVAPDDWTAVARATEEVLMDPAVTASLREKGLKRAAQFTWHEAALRTLAVYDDVLH